MYTHQFRIFDFLPTEMPFPASADIMGTTTSPRQNVTLKINGTTYTVKSDSQGRFYFNVPSGTTVTSLYQMCNNQTSIATIDITGLDTSSCTDMGEMFKGCTNLTSVDMTGLDTGSVTAMSNMFNGCTSLTTITGIKGIDTSSALYMNQMFYNCSSLTSLDLAGWDTDQVTGMSSMFYGCSSLTSLDLRTFDTTGVITSGNWTYIVPNSSSLTVRCSRTNFSSTIRETYANVNWVFGSIVRGTTKQANQQIGFILNYDRYGAGTVFTTTSGADKSFEIEIPDDFVLQGCSNMFTNQTYFTARTYAQNLETVDLSDFNTTGCMFFDEMFSYSKAVSFNVTGIITSSSTRVDSMFYECNGDNRSVTITGLDTWDTSNLWTTSQMFFDCYTLGSLDITGWDATDITSMSGMFFGCTNLSVVTGLESINPWQCTEFDSMFYGCENLEVTNHGYGVNLYNWHINSSATCYSMFNDISTSFTVWYNSSYFPQSWIIQINSDNPSINLYPGSPS